MTLGGQSDEDLQARSADGGPKVLAHYKRAVSNLLRTSFQHIHPDTRLVARFYANIWHQHGLFEDGFRRQNIMDSLAAAFSSSDHAFDFVDTQHLILDEGLPIGISGEHADSDVFAVLIAVFRNCTTLLG